ncbi:hypothetical protein HDU93_001141 [Gonapodya sp. JEL0774]|nr:hypothetical protein HDU93_001141 [Gonapodya sp. JEL0774]
MPSTPIPTSSVRSRVNSTIPPLPPGLPPGAFGPDIGSPSRPPYQNKHNEMETEVKPPFVIERKLPRWTHEAEPRGVGVKKGMSVEKDTKNTELEEMRLTSSLTSLRALSTQQSETLATLTASCAAYESQVAAQAEQIAGLKKDAEDADKRAKKAEAELQEEHSASVTDKHAKEWWEKRRMDYERAAAVLGVVLDDGALGGLVRAGPVEEAAIRRRDENERLATQTASLTARVRALENERAEQIQRSSNEYERREGELDVLRKEVENLRTEVSAARAGRDAAAVDSRRMARELGEMQEKARKEARRREEEVAEERERSAQHLARIKESHEADRERWQIQLDESARVRQSLQVEIGEALRDKRCVEMELHNAAKSVKRWEWSVDGSYLPAARP